LAIGAKTDPSPEAVQSIMCGMGAQGTWLDTRLTWANSGARSGFPCSRRSKAAMTYWSGMVAQLKDGPR